MSKTKTKHIQECNQNLERRFIDKKVFQVNEAMVSLSNIPNHPNVKVDSNDAANDQINQALLNDIQTAAQKAGVTVFINSVKSGRSGEENKGRHPSGNAADISMINGKAVSLSNKDDANKFVKELEKLGYKKNQESSNPKAVLTFEFPGHDNHVHVSNTEGGSGTNTSNLFAAGSTDGTGSSTGLGKGGEIMYKILTGDQNIA